MLLQSAAIAANVGFVVQPGGCTGAPGPVERMIEYEVLLRVAGAGCCAT